MTLRALTLAGLLASGCSVLAPLDGIFCEGSAGCAQDAGTRDDGFQRDSAPLGLHLLQASRDPARGEKSVRVELRLVNPTLQNVPLSELTVRYYLTLENALRPVFECVFVRNDAPPFHCNNIRAVIRNLDAPRPNALQVLELTFTPEAGELVAGGGMTSDFTVAARTASFDAQDQSNDHSYQMSRDPRLNDRITIHRGDGPPVWGREP